MSQQLSPSDSHGHSPAAWTAVSIMLIAAAFGGLFYVLDMPIAVMISGGFMLVGLLVGWGMAKAGWGVNGPKYQPKGH